MSVFYFRELRVLRGRAYFPIFLRTILWILGFSVAPPTNAQELRLVGWKTEAAEVWGDAIVEFERSHPGVRIVTEIAPNSSTQFHDLLAQKFKNRDTRLDVFFMDVIWPAEFASAGWALPLDNYFGFRDQEAFLGAPVLASRYGGRIFGVPLFADAGLLYYRKDLLAKHSITPPRTWPELVSAARIIQSRENDRRMVGFSAQFKQYEGLVCNMMEYILGNGGSLWNEQRLLATVDQPAAIEAIRFVRDLIVGEISHRGVLTYEEPESLAVFMQGLAVFHRNWPYAWYQANDPQISRVAGNVGVSRLPAFPGRQPVATLGGWQLGISRFSKHPELAWRFIEFMTSANVQKRVVLSTGRAPTRKALYRDPEVTHKFPQLGTILESLEAATPRPRTPVYVPLSNIMQRYFSAALTLPDVDIPRRAAAAARDMNRVLDLLREKPAP